MVLSNKKLKQKLRQDLVKNLSVSVAETNPESVSSLQSQSLKNLLDSASHKPRLTKREKRRKVDTLTRGDEPNEVEGDAEKPDEENPKKRKRDDTVEDKVGEEGGEGEEGTKKGEESQKKKPKKKKQKKKKKRKANKTPKMADEEKVEDKVKAEEIQVETERQVCLSSHVCVFSYFS